MLCPVIFTGMKTSKQTPDKNGMPTGEAVQLRAANSISPTWGNPKERIDDRAPRIPANETRPEWGDAKAVRARFGICKSTTIRLANDGKIRAASLRERGALRGKKLYSMDSVAAYIERMATGGKEESREDS